MPYNYCVSIILEVGRFGNSPFFGLKEELFVNQII